MWLWRNVRRVWEGGPCLRGNRGLRNLDTEFEEFAGEPRRTPKQIGSTHTSDQFPDLRRDVRATETLALPGPVTPEALTMPFHNGLWFDNHDCRFPVRPEVRQDDPEPSVQ
jgi:hypothetical protein